MPVVIEGEREEAAVYSRKKMHASITIMVNDHVLLNLFQVNRCHRKSRTSSFLASKYSCLSHTSRYPFYSGWFQKIIRYVTALVSYTVNSFVHRALYLFLSRLQNNWGGNKAGEGGGNERGGSCFAEMLTECFRTKVLISLKSYLSP